MRTVLDGLSCPEAGRGALLSVSYCVCVISVWVIVSKRAIYNVYTVHLNSVL